MHTFTVNITVAEQDPARARELLESLLDAHFRTRTVAAGPPVLVSPPLRWRDLQPGDRFSPSPGHVREVVRTVLSRPRMLVTHCGPAGDEQTMQPLADATVPNAEEVLEWRERSGRG